jgi:cell division protein FtsB
VKAFFYIIIGFAVVFLSVQAARLWEKQRTLQRKLGEITAKNEALRKENNATLTDLKGIEDPEAIGLELRRAGYAAPGEKVFIIVPKE